MLPPDPRRTGTWRGGGVLNLLKHRQAPLACWVVLAVQASPNFQAIAFTCVPDNPVGCVGCERDELGMKLSDKVTNAVDAVGLVGLFAKFVDPG